MLSEDGPQNVRPIGICFLYPPGRSFVIPDKQKDIICDILFIDH